MSKLGRVQILWLYVLYRAIECFHIVYYTLIISNGQFLVAVGRATLEETGFQVLLQNVC